jgi:hypothetical protein
MNQVLKLSWQIANNNTKQNGQDLDDNSNTTEQVYTHYLISMIATNT